MIDEITQRLQTLLPTTLLIEDESAAHAGHAGNGGGGHYKLTITSATFAQKSAVARHRLIYALLSDLIPNKIHALSIQANTPEEIR